MSLRAAFLALIALLFAAPAFAQEQINRYDVLVDVQRSGDIIVTETINVTSQGNQIRRGIFRDLPRYFEGEGVRYEYGYHVQSVTRDGRDEPYDTETDGGAYRIRIGDEDVLIENGAHTYVIRYRVDNQVRYFENYDEVYWNATGNEWAFPILAARVIVQLPPDAQVTQNAGYTGAQGKTGADFTYRADGNLHVWETTRPLQAGEGLTVAVGFAKGVIDPPSSGDEAAMWWQRYGALSILGISLAGLFFFLYRAFTRVGRDPPKGPVFPRYEAPRGYSPAAVHHIYNRAADGNRALIATLMNLAVKGRISIDASDKKQTVLLRTPGDATDDTVAPEDLSLERSLFSSGSTKTLGGTYDSAFTTAYNSFQQEVMKKYGDAYFRWNLAYILGALTLSVLVVVLAVTQVVNWTLWHTFGVIAIAALNVAFMYFLPAPTVKGQAVRTEIEGLKLYLETAEKLQLNAVEVGSEQPPMMTKERYERFLPFAVALGVEAPWTKYFESVLPQVAETYNPGWTTMHSSHSIAALNSAMIANITSGVTTALPQSSGSSGSGGGGSSGGGGGGGGGGGW